MHPGDKQSGRVDQTTRTRDELAVQQRRTLPRKTVLGRLAIFIAAVGERCWGWRAASTAKAPDRPYTIRTVDAATIAAHEDAMAQLRHEFDL